MDQSTTQPTQPDQLITQNREIQTEDAATRQNVIPIAKPSGVNSRNSCMDLDNVYSAGDNMTAVEFPPIPTGQKCRFCILHFYY